ncbi:TlpA family protein disulfide reductase [Psychrosphaera sp. B3R10]|uniref:TlpA family protein disulfide reductase n=1 Tax=unclassified Psychrosphaera TaxID=2641570 RepID=UPI001C0A2DA8|nr:MULTISPECIES: TlpA disulfide reductase family protein [unclassified Psychrosphaera]MBU2883806.1 TlpA family protein disulfide reductase [Psychrosphaera sp. I2R16]MBU2990205.1 TlpA family protein disulfide reductase [Psychrosphaera sp. B3R10]
MKLKIVLMVFVFLSGCGKAVTKGEPATAFSLSSLVSDQTITLSDYKGKVVYLDFWASWCKPCIESFPKLDKLHSKYKDQGFAVIAVNLDQSKDLALAFLQTNSVGYQVLYDDGAKVAGLYDVSSMPSSYFIDKKGIVRLAHQGFRPGDEIKIEKAIQHLLAEK